MSPSTLKNYVLGIQRGFLSEWGYDLKLTSGPIFNDSKNRLFAVLENKAREQQRNGRHVVSHNVLSRDDLIKLCTPHSLSKDSAKGLQARLIFTVGILTTMRTSALVSLRVSQFRKMEVRNRSVWMIVRAMGGGGGCGASRTARGGLGAILNKVPEIPVSDETYDDGDIKFYRDIDEYIDLRSSLEVGMDRCSLGVNPDAKHLRDFLRRQYLGQNAFMAVVKNVCMKERIEESGKKIWVTTHGLKGTLATLLFQEGHSDAFVALRTGHRDPRSLKSYQNLHRKQHFFSSAINWGAKVSHCTKRLAEVQFNSRRNWNKPILTRYPLRTLELSLGALLTLQ